MVTSEESDAVGVLQLEAKQELESLHRVVATIHEVTHEDVLGVGDLAALFEKLEQVVELTMDVTANCHGCAHGLHVAFLDKDLLDLLTQLAQASFRQDATVLHSSEPGVDVSFARHSFILLL